MTEKNGLKEYLDKCSLQIDEVVELIRGQLTKMARITLGALIVMDVHGEKFNASFILLLKMYFPF